MRRSTVPGRQPVVAALTVLCLLAAGCVDTDGAISGDRCGDMEHVAAAPDRVVVDHQQIAETLARIEVADRVVGVYGDMLTVPPDEIADDVADMRFLGGGAIAPPPADVIAGLDADLTILGAEPPAGRAPPGPVVRLGTACGNPPQSIADALDEVLALGELVAVAERAAKVVAELRDGVEERRRRAETLRTRPVVLTHAGDVRTPVRAANGLIGELVALAGGRDVVATSRDVRTAVRTSDAGVFLVVSHASLEDPHGFLCSVSLGVRENLFRAFPDIPATRDERALIMPTEQAFGGVRLLEDIDWLARQLAA